MVDVHVLRVFTQSRGVGGNALGVVLDSASLSDEDKQNLATRLGYSETVFVEDVEAAKLRIFTPSQEIKLGGHPLVGTAWLLMQELGRPVESLHPVQVDVALPVWQEGRLTWVRARIADMPPWKFVQQDLPTKVDLLAAPPSKDYTLHMVWAWQVEKAGRIRARAFAPSMGIVEDEATGSAAMLLAANLGRELQIQQGEGSVVHARPAAEAGWGEIGGRVVSDGLRQLNPTPTERRPRRQRQER